MRYQSDPQVYPLAPRGVADLDIAYTGTRKPVMDRRKPTLVAVGSEDLPRLSIIAAMARVLPPPPPQRSITCSPQ